MRYEELKRRVARCAHALREQSGVRVGDVVAAYAPNCPEVVVWMLAAASLGAIFTATSPDFGVVGVLERFQQTAPKVLLSCNAVFYNGRVHCLGEKLRQVVAGLESLIDVVVIEYVPVDMQDGTEAREDADLHLSPEDNHSQKGNSKARHVSWDAYLGTEDRPLVYEQLPFDHPLYIMYSSGTTGKPKCLVHSAGGTLIQHKKELMLHADLRPRDVIFQYTTVGWMMWQWLVSALSVGATVVLYDGSPLTPHGGAPVGDG